MARRSAVGVPRTVEARKVVRHQFDLPFLCEDHHAGDDSSTMTARSTRSPPCGLVPSWALVSRSSMIPPSRRESSRNCSTAGRAGSSVDHPAGDQLRSGVQHGQRGPQFMAGVRYEATLAGQGVHRAVRQLAAR